MIIRAVFLSFLVFSGTFHGYSQDGETILEQFRQTAPTEFLELHKTFFDNFYNRSEVQKEEYIDALRVINSDIQKLPMKIELRLEKSILSLILENMEVALDSLQEAERINPKNPLIYYILATILQNSHQGEMIHNLYTATLLSTNEIMVNNAAFGQTIADWYRNEDKNGYKEVKYGFSDLFYDLKINAFTEVPFFEKGSLPKTYFQNFSIIDNNFSIHWEQQIDVAGKNLGEYRLVSILPWGQDQLHFLYMIFYKD